jgi:hypothetical protein
VHGVGDRIGVRRIARRRGAMGGQRRAHGIGHARPAERYGGALSRRTAQHGIDRGQGAQRSHLALAMISHGREGTFGGA